MKKLPFFSLALAGLTSLSAVQIDTDTVFNDGQTSTDTVGWNVLATDPLQPVQLTVESGADLTKTNVSGDDFGISLGSTTVPAALLFEAGSLTVTDLESGAAAYGLRVLGGSIADINGGEIIVNESGNGTGYGIFQNHTSSLTVRGGTLRLTESSKGDAAVFYLRGSSNLEYRSGAVELTEADQQDAVIFDCYDDSTSVVYSGDFDATSNGTVFLARLNQNATLALAGGDYAGVSGTPKLKLTSSTSSLELVGSGFELDTGSGFVAADAGVISALTGTVRLTLSDGSVLTADFTQATAGQIEFVDAPTSGTLIMLSSFGTPSCLLLLIACLSSLRSGRRN